MKQIDGIGFAFSRISASAFMAFAVKLKHLIYINSPTSKWLKNAIKTLGAECHRRCWLGRLLRFCAFLCQHFVWSASKDISHQILSYFIICVHCLRLRARWGAKSVCIRTAWEQNAWRGRCKKAVKCVMASINHQLLIHRRQILLLPSSYRIIGWSAAARRFFRAAVSLNCCNFSCLFFRRFNNN